MQYLDMYELSIESRETNVIADLVDIEQVNVDPALMGPPVSFESALCVSARLQLCRQW